MKPFTRAERVSGLIRRALSELLQKNIKDPRLEMVTITAVKMSRDLRIAKVYFSTYGGKTNKDKVIKGFQNAFGYIKRCLGNQLGLRYMPDLKFFYDESFDYGSHIDKVLKSIKIENESDHQPVEK
ncbi:MAG: 30S ribosome-binding factor RbfA [Desulfobacterales bacterium]|jgi:ribosome-binding factor A|nr:30S ribosome-binding factor RbfA [Desulfobacterales bacterium]MDP7354197.1 30S ribosome-binding factor RbfA [Desulfobacterales bacterium]